MDIDQPAQTIAEFVLGIPEMHQLIVGYISINSICGTTHKHLKRNRINSTLYNFLCVCKRSNAISHHSIQDHLHRMNPYQIVRLLRAGKIPAVKYITTQGIYLSTWECAYAHYANILDNVDVNPAYIIKTGMHGAKYPTGFGPIAEPYFIRSKNPLQSDFIRIWITTDRFKDYTIGVFVDIFKKFIYESRIPSCEPFGNIVRTQTDCYSKFISKTIDIYQDYYDNYLSRYEIMCMIFEFFEELDLVGSL